MSPVVPMSPAAPTRAKHLAVGCRHARATCALRATSSVLSCSLPIRAAEGSSDAEDSEVSSEQQPPSGECCPLARGARLAPAWLAASVAHALLWDGPPCTHIHCTHCTPAVPCVGAEEEDTSDAELNMGLRRLEDISEDDLEEGDWELAEREQRQEELEGQLE